MIAITLSITLERNLYFVKKNLVKLLYNTDKSVLNMSLLRMKVTKQESEQYSLMILRI